MPKLGYKQTFEHKSKTTLNLRPHKIGEGGWHYEGAKGVCKNTGRTHFKKGDIRLIGNKNALGHSAWNKGTKGLMVAWNKGKPLPQMRGENNPNWKGGTYGSERHREMGKVEYKLWRADVFEKDNYTCQACFSKGVYLNADHIKGWAEFPELRYEISNGQTLCNSCHYFKTFGRQKPNNINWGKYKQKEGIQL